MDRTGENAGAENHALTAARPPSVVPAGRFPALAAVVCVLLAACGGGERVRISQDQLLASITERTAPAVVDVRTGGEYAKGHVPGAVHIPFYRLWSRHAEIGAGKDDAVVVYCAHGPRAGVAKFALWTLGYERVAYLEGHMSAWKNRGLPMHTGRRP